MGPVSTAFRLRDGDIGPVQQSPVTCGSACLTVARMLVDPVFARWITRGEGSRLDAPAGATEGERFAAYEHVVMARTNGLLAGGGRWNLPWPRALGTPPWGAKKELEHGASRRGAEYEVDVLREERRGRLRASHAHLVDVVSDGEPALLYVGNRLLPRHVVLVLPDDGGDRLDVYDPGTGRVSVLTQDAFARRRLRLSGWDVPWMAVQPTGVRTVRAASGAALARSPGVPSRSPGSVAPLWSEDGHRTARSVRPAAASRPEPAPRP